MNNNKWQDITIALAGMLQAMQLIHELAQHGNCDQDSLKTCLNSVFILDASSTLAIYNDNQALQSGLVLLEKFCNKTKVNPNILRYFFSLMMLERKLMSDRAKAQALTERITQSIRQRDYFQDVLNPSVIGSLANIYMDFFSQLKFRIIVQGDRNYLTQEDIADKIRALLLAGIRAAVLWKQVGGNRWQFLLSRQKILVQIKQLLT